MPDGETTPTSNLEIHGTLHLESAALEDRLKKLEDKQKEDGWGTFWTWVLDILKTLLPSIVLALVGFALKDGVDQALHEREIKLAAVKEMETLAPDLQKTDLARPDAQAKAAQLAAYGSYSVPFFVNILEVGNQNAGVGAEDGLRMVARSEPELVCTTVDRVITNRTGLYRWQTQLSALKVMGQVGCTNACRNVADFRNKMSSLQNYGSWVSTPPMQTEYDKVAQQAADTLKVLQSIAPGECN